MYLGFCFLLCFLGECGACVLPVKKFCYDPDTCDQYMFQVKYVSKFLELTLRNGDGLGGRGREGPKEKSMLFYHEKLSLLGTGTEHEERPKQVVCYKAGNETVGWLWRRGGNVNI